MISTIAMEDMKIVNVLKVERIGVTPDYESKWVISLKIENKKHIIKETLRQHGYVTIIGGLAQITITRLDVQEQDDMEEQVKQCETVDDVCRLYFEVYYN